jgi:hypothetical protein
MLPGRWFAQGSRISRSDVRRYGLYPRRLFEQFFDRFGEPGAKSFKQIATLPLGESQHPRGGVDEPASDLMSVSQETLPQREGINFQGQPIHQSVPAVCETDIDRVEVSLNDPLVAERP